MSRVEIYKLECSNTGCDVVRATPFVPGSQDDPRVETQEYIAIKLNHETAEKIVEALNDAFNLGRDFARQR